MKSYAKIENNVVTQVIEAEQSFIDTLPDKEKWLETSHTIRKHYAGIGYIYDPKKDVFIPQQPFPSWVLNEETLEYEPPIPFPESGTNHDWDEATKSWKVNLNENGELVKE